MISKNKQLFFSALLLSFTGLNAQTAVSTAGGEATGSGGSMSYTVGQVAYNSQEGEGVTLSEGVQQPFEISIITGVNNDTEIDLTYSAYPNPIIDQLTLDINTASTNLSYEMYNMGGTLMQTDQLSNGSNQLLMTDFIPAVYYLKIKSNEEEIKAFKVIKR